MRIRSSIVDAAGFKYITIDITIVITMSTTIQVSDKTRQMIEIAKRQTGAKSIDEALEKVLGEQLHIPKSMFGKFRGKMKSFTRKERLEMWKF